MKRFFKISFYSYGGESVMGLISKEQYDYWTLREKEEKGALGEYLSKFEFDPETANQSIPNKSRLNCSWFENDDIVHVSGPEVTDENYVEIIETDKDENQINSKEYPMEMDLLANKFKLVFEDFGPDHEKVRGKYFFLGQSFEKGVWDTTESGMGLIETDEAGLNKNNLIFNIVEVYGNPTCSAVSVNDVKYDLVGNTSTNASSMNIYKGN
tara:strand:- start:94 stop:726 length:633 start_codon:yes stop_codon:yes gene_type:complete